MGRVEGRTALVTGGAGGIGLAVARRLLHEGATVVVSDLDAERLAPAAHSLGPTAIALPHDVRERASWARLVDEILARTGRIDILVNNAGIASGSAADQDLENVSIDDWRAVHAVNVEGALLGCRAIIAPMRAAGGGSIINIASVAAVLPTPTLAAYGASKAALVQLTKSVALLCAQRGDRIRCNAVLPGLVATGLFEQTFSAAERAGRLRAVPLGEAATPEDVAALVLYLAGDESRHVTGARFVVDGGMTML